MTFHRTLRLGSRGYDVDGVKRAVYRLLDDGAKWKGYLRQTETSRRTFGPFFREDVKLAQRELRRRKLYAGAIDGVVGRDTFEGLRRAGAFDALAERLVEQQRPAHVFPLPEGTRYSVVGYPNQGTHRAYDWQSRNAIDLHAPAGTYVMAPITGRAYRVGGSEGIRYVGGKIIFGRKLTIVPPAGDRCFLTHLSGLRVSEGQLLRAGDVVGRIGNYGPGSHLHIALEHANPLGILRWPTVPVEV